MMDNPHITRAIILVMASKTKIGIVGGGSVGLTYAALLAPVADVVLKTRTDEQSEHVNTRGVTLLFRDSETTKDGETFTAKVKASADISSLKDCDVILVTVKSYDTELIAKELSGIIKQDCEVVTVQNGLQAYDVLRNNIPNSNRIFAGITWLGAQRVDDHSVKQGMVFTTIIDDKAVKTVDALRQSRFGVEPSANISQAVWEKMLINTGQNALSAITDLHLGQIYENKDCLDIARHLVDEFVEVAKAEGITFSFEPFEKLQNNWPGSKFYPSMWQDIHHGRKTEIDAINGEIVARAKKHGIETPYNEMITSLVKIAEAKRQQV